MPCAQRHVQPGAPPLAPILADSAALLFSLVPVTVIIELKVLKRSLGRKALRQHRWLPRTVPIRHYILTVILPRHVAGTRGKAAPN